MFDYHVHTSFSADCEMSMEEACTEAIAKGLQEIAFTDHVDVIYPGSDLVWEFDVQERTTQIEKMREKFGDRLTVLNGVEVGLHPRAKDENRQFTAYPFDFVIGSTHIVDDLDLHFGEYFEGKSADEALRHYFETINENVKNEPHFHVLGHIDLIKRYVHYLDLKIKDIPWRKYDDIVEDTLKHLIHTGRGMEINMSGHRYQLGCTLPDLPIVRLYQELGGEIITVGSDAHTAPYVGRDMQEGYELLHQAGFRYVTTYRQGDPQFVPLADVRV